MQAKRDDDLKDSFYLYIMRNSIGAGLRSQYAPNGQMPERLAKLLHELETDRGGKEPAGGRAAGEERAKEEEPAARPARKRARKR